MQKLDAKETQNEEGHLIYDVKWTIPDWRQVRQDVSLVNEQMVVFETGIEPPQRIQTKWLVGMTSTKGVNRQYAELFWQLIDIQGSLESSPEIDDVHFYSYFVDDDDALVTDNDLDPGIVSLYDRFVMPWGLTIGTNLGEDLDNEVGIDEEGALLYNLVLTISIKPDKTADNRHFQKLAMEQLLKGSVDLNRQKLGALLNEDLINGDLKIVTMDGVELSAHQNILKAESPVFAGMLNSDFCERRNGVVKVDDLSGKTMKILLHYIYTGDLKDGWSDGDTIVEFTNAAGKYQISKLLEFLDNWLGLGGEYCPVTNLDVQLLSLAEKLGLKNAEKRLLSRVIGKVVKVKASEGLLKLFGCESDDLCNNNEVQGPDNYLEVFGDLSEMFESSCEQMDSCRRGRVLVVLQKNKWKGLEGALLSRVADIVKKFTKTEQLFSFFGYGK